MGTPHGSKLQRVGAGAAASQEKSEQTSMLTEVRDDQKRRDDKHALCRRIQKLIAREYIELSANPNLATLSIAAHRSEKVEALPDALRAIKRISRFNHLSTYLKMEEGQAYGIEVRIGFVKERGENWRGSEVMKRRVEREIGAKFDLRWTD